MARWAYLTIVTSLLASSSFRVAAEQDIGNGLVAEALAQGRLSAELRPRYNRIDEGDKPLRAEGWTGRAMAGWRSGPFRGLRATIEGIHAGHLGAERWNDDSALRLASPYPLLPDPVHTGVSQAFVDYAGVDGARLRAGRQVVRFGNQRWVSDNDFRQIPQVFDGASLGYGGISNLQLTAGHFLRVRNTSGALQDLRLTLLEAAWNPRPGHALSAYGVFHDQPQNGAFTGYANNSYRVAGVRAAGVAARHGEVDLEYTVELARQRPFAGGHGAIDAVYWRVGAGLGSDDWTLRYDHEVKGSNNGRYGVQMPLTDFYAFNGWALRFFNTPRQGLRDGWLTARYEADPVTLFVEAHRFRSDYGNIDFGREVDMGLTFELGDYGVVRLQHGRYQPAAGSADARIRKTWLTFTYSY
jgi:hypothetical protein